MCEIKPFWEIPFFEYKKPKTYSTSTIYFSDTNYAYSDSFEVEVPGFCKDDLKIEVVKGTLKISGEKNGRSITKVFLLDKEVIGVEVEVKDGLAKVKLEKKKEEIKVTVK